MSNAKPLLSFAAIRERLREVSLPAGDHVVGIHTGGTVPAALVAYRMGLPLDYLHLRFRNPDNKPESDAPRLLAPVPDIPPGVSILLVDDVSVSRATFRRARACFPRHPVVTIAFKGSADVVLFPEIEGCVRWPWSVPSDVEPARKPG